jgi:hypothetical protein
MQKAIKKIAILVKMARTACFWPRIDLFLPEILKKVQIKRKSWGRERFRRKFFFQLTLL